MRPLFVLLHGRQSACKLVATDLNQVNGQKRFQLIPYYPVNKKSIQLQYTYYKFLETYALITLFIKHSEVLFLGKNSMKIPSLGVYLKQTL